MNNETSDDELADALSRWLQKSLEIISARPHDFLGVATGLPCWYVESDGTYLRSSNLAIYNYKVLERELFDDFLPFTILDKSLSAHQKFLKHTVPVFGKLGDFVQLSSNREFCRNLLPIPKIRNGRITIDTSLDVNGTISKFVAEINSTTLVSTTIWPVAGIATESAIKLGANIEFRELTLAEKLTCLNFEIIKGWEPHRISAGDSRWFGLCLTEIEEKLFGERATPLQALTNRIDGKEAIIESFLSIVPLVIDQLAYHAGGTNGVPGFEFGGMLSSGIFGHGVSTGSHRFLYSDMNVAISDAQSAYLADLWGILQSGSPSKFQKRVVNAARRLYYADIRTHPEDMITDCMIAAESLYLDVESSELSYRLALNASLWAEGNAARRREVFDLLRQAYTLRSKVVHGSSADSHAIRSIINELKNVIREGIRKAFKSLKTSSAAPNWVNIIHSELGGAETFRN